MRLIPLAIVLAFASGAALAQQAAPQPAIEPGTLSAWSEYDVNGDGRIETTEFLSLVPPEAQAAARGCDADGDGALSQAEYDVCAGLAVAQDTQPAPR